MVVAEYASAACFSLLGMLFWDPAFSGCDATCPANLLLVRRLPACLAPAVTC